MQNDSLVKGHLLKVFLVRVFIRKSPKLNRIYRSMDTVILIGMLDRLTSMFQNSVSNRILTSIMGPSVS